MYITRVSLRKIRCFKKLDLEFGPVGESLLIAADNGDGKTTLLRSIAMGLCDQSSASALFRELSGQYVRKRAHEDGKIEIQLRGRNGLELRTVTTIKPGDILERVVQEVYERRGPKAEWKGLDNPDDFSWQSIFVCGYGAGRQTQGTADVDEYAALDAMYTLFKYYDPLQNSELAVRRLQDKARARAGKEPRKREAAAKRTLETIRSLLKGILDLEPDDAVDVTPTAIVVKGHWGRDKLASLGDGYRATVTWVLDFLSWRMLSGKTLDPKKMEGIVLLDEVEQHLHPRWQLKVVQLLTKAFPKMQFIVTTHSPSCVAGCTEVEETPWQILSLVPEKRAVVARSASLPRGLRIDQVLTSGVFGLASARSPEIGKREARFRELLLKTQRSTSEQRELGRLRKFVGLQVPEAGQFETEYRLRGELRTLVEKLERLNSRAKR